VGGWRGQRGVSLVLPAFIGVVVKASCVLPA
jgi:hypothetical protein